MTHVRRCLSLGGVGRGREKRERKKSAFSTYRALWKHDGWKTSLLRFVPSIIYLCIKMFAAAKLTVSILICKTFEGVNCSLLR